jgi:hypothetical protein
MVLTGKQKAVAAFVITLVLGVLGTLTAFSGIDPMVKEYLTLAVSIVTVVGTTIGVFATTNTPAVEAAPTGGDSKTSV